MKKLLLAFVVFMLIVSACKTKPTVTGELKKWHKIALTFDGPQTSETDAYNPFLNYRLNVVFTNGDTKLDIPGFYAADGNAAITSATEGNKWRVYFTPPKTGVWNYEVSFVKGENVAVACCSKEGESAGFFDGITGELTIAESDKPADDFRTKGRLNYVGEHYLQFADSKDYFLKAGADAPENLFAYVDFDAVPNVNKRIKTYDAHAADYNTDADAFLWGTEKNKGKNLLGAINYLASKGMNVFSFLTFNVDGDDRNVFPHLLNVSIEEYNKTCSNKKYIKAWEELVVHTRFDVSKMAQWERVFDYGQMKGMYLHFKTQENENDQSMDNGETGLTRKLYYRELIARYGHHLALNWNLGEEMTQTTEQIKDMAQYFYDNDPYAGNIVLHTFPHQQTKVYKPLLGDASKLTGLSVQTSKPDFIQVHDSIKFWVKASALAGKKWVVAIDEPGDAKHSLIPDDEDSTRYLPRVNALWGSFLAGGAGIEWYFGYQHPHSDLTCEDWRTRDKMWEQSKIALDFFRENLPFWEMTSADELISDNNYCFAKPGEVYAVMLRKGGNAMLDLSNTDKTLILKWFDPRTGAFIGEATELKGGNLVKLTAPSNNEDWVALIK